MTAQVNRRLVSSIVGGHFGESVRAVADVLVVRGDLSLSALVHFSGHSGRVVREALFVLIHHSLVLYSGSNGNGNGNARGSSTANSVVYRLDLEAVLLRMVYPMVAALVDEQLATQTGDLLLTVMARGRMAVESVAADHIDALDALLREGILQGVSPEMSQFRLHDGAEDTPPPLPSSPTKRRRETDDRASTTDGGKRARTTAIRPKFVRFNARETVFRLLLGQRLMKSVTARLNPAAGKLVGCLLALAHDRALFSDGAVQNGGLSLVFNAFQLEQKTPPSIAAELLVDDMGRGRGSFSPPALHQYLQILAADFDYIQPHAGGGVGVSGELYAFDLTRAHRHLRLLILETYISVRFGGPSARVFRILLKKRMVEERQIAKLAMLTGKDVRERLYQLLQLGLVQLQEVPRTVDHAPSRTIFLWTVHQDATHGHSATASLFRMVASRTVTALLNLRELAVLERSKHAQLLTKVERSDVARDPSLLSGMEQRQLADLKRVLDVLKVKTCHLLTEYVLLQGSFPGHHRRE